MDNIKNYVRAEGPEGLKKVLEDLFVQATQDPVFAKQEHYVLYQLGGLKSMMRVDTDQAPFKFWCHDLMGRPMTLPMREVLMNFLWEHWGESELSL